MDAIETERLLLRRWSRDDLEEYVRLCADPEVMRFIGRGVPYTRAEATRSFAAHARHWETHGYGLFVVLERATGAWAGLAGLARVDAGYEGAAADEVEIGWRLGRAHWGRGLGTEAARAGRDHAFARLGLERLVAMVQPGNAASRRIVEKLGMRLRGNGSGRWGESILVYELERAQDAES